MKITKTFVRGFEFGLCMNEEDGSITRAYLLSNPDSGCSKYRVIPILLAMELSELIAPGRSATETIHGFQNAERQITDYQVNVTDEQLHGYPTVSEALA